MADLLPRHAAVVPQDAAYRARAFVGPGARRLRRHANDRRQYAGANQTLPLYIYRQVESLNFGAAHVAAGILVAVGVACLAAVRRMETNRHERMV